MRQSVLSRSVVALATLAVGSAVLAAVPATAATSSGITRSQVLNAAQLTRDDPAASSGNPTALAPATSKALRVLANRACAIDHDDEVAVYNFGLPVASGDSADGLMVLAQIIDPSTPSMQNGRMCIFGVLAAAKGSTTLSGAANLTTDAVRTYALSGDVFVTPARSFVFDSEAESEPPFDMQDLAFTASGTATTLTKATTTKTIKTPKTKAQKKSAKKKYDQALSSAKKAYKKALKKAGTSGSKKTSAKKAYDKKKASAKKTYQRRIATTKVTTVTTVTKTPAPFDVAAMRIPATPE